MTKQFLAWLKDRGSWRMIRRDGEDYLERYILFHYKGASVYLHRFWMSDLDDVHSHPWWSFSYILKGGYREWFIGDKYVDRKPGDKILRDATTFHKVDLNGAEPGSAWTLFVTWNRKAEWGFLAKDGYVSASEYLSGHDSVAVYGRDFVYEGIFFPKIKWLTELR